VKKLRRKVLQTLLLITFIILVSIPTHKAKAAGAALKVSSIYNFTEVGKTVNVNITAMDVTSLLRWIVNLKWNSSIIKISTGDTKGIRKVVGVQYVYFNIYEGPFIEDARLDQDAIFLANVINNTGGRISGLSGGYTSFGSTPSGSGTVATINFTYLQAGEATIEVTYSFLMDGEGNEIEHAVVNGTITDKPPPVPPIWSELWFQGTIVGIGVVAVVATAFRYRKKIAQHLPKREEEADELVEEDLRFQKSRT